MPAPAPVLWNTSSRLILHFDRPAAFFGQHHRHRFEVDDGLTAKTSADFGRDGLDVAGRHASNRGGQAANHELSLAAAPDGGLGIGLVTDEAGLRLDIALMHGGRLELALNYQIRLSKTLFDIASFDRHDA